MRVEFLCLCEWKNVRMLSFFSSNIYERIECWIVLLNLLNMSYVYKASTSTMHEIKCHSSAHFLLFYFLSLLLLLLLIHCSQLLLFFTMIKNAKSGGGHGSDKRLMEEEKKKSLFFPHIM